MTTLYKRGETMKFENSVVFKVSGREALFTDPLTKMGGEKFSYPVPTYQALKGILESCYWKPTLVWIVDQVRILNCIQTENKSVRPIVYGAGSNTLSIYTYLKDVSYIVKAHFEWNQNRPELTADRNEHKHFCIAKRMIEKGGRRDVFLGTRECQAYVEPCEFYEGKGEYDTLEELSFGMMVHGINYPDETGRKKLEVRLWRPVMKKGVITFPRPEECRVVRELRNARVCRFIPNENFSFCDCLYEREVEKD